MSIARLTLALLMAMLATSIQAETINCTPITALPATITAQGIYCLTHKLGTSQTSGTAITINANNVTLDLNGWKVDGGSAGTGTSAYGIFSNSDNVTIKNGIVRGFSVAIYLAGTGDVVQDVLVDSNLYVGIWTAGPGAKIEHNQVVNTGNSPTTNNSTWALAIEGNTSTVINNTVSGVTPNGSGFADGIQTGGTRSTVRDNTVSNTAGGTSYGIVVDDGIAVNNTVSGFVTGIDFPVAGIYAYNTVYGCTTDFLGGTAGAGNSGT
ncbi:MAG TPA: hypothetical protein VNF46_05405 [Gammaproteobacteria bacterium]|nr:hypothetical protein [Gammaproteobacteria bacterium]